MSKKTVAKPSGLERLKEKLPALLVLAVIAGGVAVMIYKSMDQNDSGSVDVTVPALSALAQTGAYIFAANCAQCHGANAAGGDGGPPLVHDIYNPGHHGDGSFWIAVQRGVPQHHWRFGNMPPQPQVTKEDAAAIVRYVRELQIANGIRYKAHRMN
jgi:mono/diheme cytochrome c family protein